MGLIQSIDMPTAMSLFLTRSIGDIVMSKPKQLRTLLIRNMHIKLDDKFYNPIYINLSHQISNYVTRLLYNESYMFIYDN